MKRKKNKGEKIFASHIYDTGFASRIYKGPSKLNNKKTEKPIFLKKGKDVNSSYLKEDNLDGR